MIKSLEQKLHSLRNTPNASDFILADAKDPDMAFGIKATGPGNDGGYRTVQEFRQQIRDIVAQGIVDIVIMSPSTNEQLALEERIFEGSPVTPASRVNDSTDIWLADGGTYGAAPSRPFRTATLDHIQFGSLTGAKPEVSRGTDLGLYSITFNNDAERDRESLQAFKKFRLEAEAASFRYIYEIFAPNVSGAVPEESLARYMNDMIVRSLAGVTESARPIFLKMPYLGAAALEELVRYDSSIIVGILGGSAGTTMDAFTLLSESKKYGARAALFGRKINNAEHQLSFIEHLRRVADDEMTPKDAVKSYHDALHKHGVPPARPLDDDQLLSA